MTVAVAVLDDYQSVAEGCADWSVLAPDAEVTFFSDRLPLVPELVERLAPFEIVGVMRERTPFSRALLEQLPDLRLLVTTGRRNAAIDVAAAAELGIMVSGTTSPGHATAELAMAMILSLARNLEAETRSMRAGGWQVGLGRDLHGATLGVVGLGRLGARVATIGLAFGMHVVAWSEHLTTERCEDVGVQCVDQETLFRISDYISIHLRLSERTRGLVSEEVISMMKPDAYLVNTSRGPIVDEAALRRALEAGAIAGAGLDVYGEEPLPVDDPLRVAPNVVLTPHIGYVTRETYRVFYGEMVETIRAYLDGDPIRVITPE